MIASLADSGTPTHMVVTTSCRDGNDNNAQCVGGAQQSKVNRGNTGYNTYKQQEIRVCNPTRNHGMLVSEMRQLDNMV